MGRGGFLIFCAPVSPKHFNFFSPPRLRPTKARDERRRLHECPGSLGEILLSSWVEGAKKVPRALVGPPPLTDPAAKHKTPESSFSPQLPHICSPWPALK